MSTKDFLDLVELFRMNYSKNTDQTKNLLQHQFQRARDMQQQRSVLSILDSSNTSQETANALIAASSSAGQQSLADAGLPSDAGNFHDALALHRQIESLRALHPAGEAGLTESVLKTYAGDNLLLQRLIAESAALQQRKSLDSLLQLRRLEDLQLHQTWRLEDLQLQQAWLGSGGGSLVSALRDASSPGIAGTPGGLFGGNVSVSSMLRGGGLALGEHLNAIKRKTVEKSVDDENTSEYKKKKFRNSSTGSAANGSTFPLPPLSTGDVDYRFIPCELVSYERLWKKLGKCKMQKEVFLRRVHSKNLFVIGTSRSVIHEADVQR